MPSPTASQASPGSSPSACAPSALEASSPPEALEPAGRSASASSAIAVLEGTSETFTVLVPASSASSPPDVLVDAWSAPGWALGSE